MWRRAFGKARGIFTESFQTVSATKEVFFAIMLKRTSSAVLVDSHSADGIDCRIICVYTLDIPGAVFFHAVTGPLRDSPHVPAKFPKRLTGSQKIMLNMRGMTFAEPNSQPCL